jgi:hypothetical protein
MVGLLIEILNNFSFIRNSIDEIEKKEKFNEIYEKYEKYEDVENIHTIWFNPWENENHQEPMVGLLQEIHNHFSFIRKSLTKAQKLQRLQFKQV